MTDSTTPTPAQIELLRKFSIVSGMEAKRVGVKVGDCRRLVDLGLLSETGTPRRYRLTHQGYIASHTSTFKPADFAA